MDFNTFLDFFDSLKYAKRRYPMIITYNKYLSKIITVEDKNAEIECFKHFLILNQSINDKKFDDPNYKTGKPSLTLAMNNFETDDNVFWEKINDLEKQIFKDGSKPKEVPKEEPKVTGLTGTLSSFENNPIMLDVISQVSKMGDLGNIDDVSDLMNRPEFKFMVQKIKNNLEKGKYSIRDLTTTVTDVIKSVKHELDDETKNTLDVVTQTMDAVSREEPVDMNTLINVVSGLKLDNLSGK
jgi:BMFP domain-containing protein YqiC